MNLNEFFKKNPKVAIGFSGGVDSAYLLYKAKECGADIQPYYIKTAFQPEFELYDALRLCEKIGVKLRVIEYDILSHKDIAKNPENRCYYCKKVLFSTLKAQAQKDGYALIIDGTNASDDLSDRPGAKAISELSVRSPLRECGLTKDEIRKLSKEAGLFTWNKPSYSCLATRVKTNTVLNKTLLGKVEATELELMSLGFSDFRVRTDGDTAKLEIKKDQLDKAENMHNELLNVIKKNFKNEILEIKER
ncbi:MAG: ATP-dependent sacrificial sulfur transferase LarE [Clostridia bacterium]|nr:ATP-dependent sacrificial sulfur transferase LarE [Clostridia bacterium]